jgi:hypothetical protein
MSDKQKRREFLAKGLTYGTTLVVAGACLPRCLQAAIAGEPSTNAPAGEKPKALEDLAYCGFDCQKECELYKATQANDMEVKQATAKRWAEKYGVTLKPEEVACDGCRSHTGRLGYHCGHLCEVRKCGLARKVKSCATCDDFPSCDKPLWNSWPEMRRRTEDRRKQLKGSRSE